MSCFDRSFSVIVNKQIFEYERGRYLDEKGDPQLRFLQNRYGLRPVILITAKANMVFDAYISNGFVRK